VGYGLAGFTTYDSRKRQPNFTFIKGKKLGKMGCHNQFSIQVFFLHTFAALKSPNG
jgi:hypothetical protein